MKTFRQKFSVLCAALFLLAVIPAAAQEKDAAAGDKKEQAVEEKKALPESTEKKADTAAEKKPGVKTVPATKPAAKKTDVKAKKTAKAPVKKIKTTTDTKAKPGAGKTAPKTTTKKPDAKTGKGPEKKAEPEKESKKDILTDAEIKTDTEPVKDTENIAEKKEAAADDTAAPKPQIIVINPGSADAAAWSSTWGPLGDGAGIYAWGRGLRLYMKEDMGPVVDKTAAFVSIYGTYVTVKDLRTAGLYTLWLDLVAFRNPDAVQFSSILKIFIRSRRYDYRLVHTCSFPHAGGELVRIEIPYEMSAEGEITILFRELSPMKRAWGIWDMIITDTRELPLSPDYYRQFHEPVKLPVKEKILE